jgi:acyl carrier protein
LCGGEALPPALAQALRRRVRALWNLYGPTETTIWSAAAAVGGDDEGVPIGRPVANTTLRILDAALEPVALGIPAEVWIGGAGVARGYAGRADLTAERFVPDAAAEEPGARLYRTGDLARWRADGQVDFLGRRDHQLKLRGFRIEPGEIEAAVAEHPAVGAVAVLLREDVPGDPRLVAYVAGDGEIAPGELSEICGRRLPEYMVPSAFVRLAELPRTPNGKLDRAALPPPDATTAPSTDYVAPRGELEEVVAQLFASVLGVERVGAHDRFFALGGHSLTAARLLLQLGQAFGVELPLPGFFEQPTVAGVARALVALETQPGRSETIARLLRRLDGMTPGEITAGVRSRRAARQGAVA